MQEHMNARLARSRYASTLGLGSLEERVPARRYHEDVVRLTDEELQAEAWAIRRELRHQIISMLLTEGRRTEDVVEEARKIVAFIEEG